MNPESASTDMRFVKRVSSSSSTMILRPSTEQPIHILKWQPRHDRGYSISDGDISDADIFADSAGTSCELAKAGHSGTLDLESLPEARPLVLEADRNNTSRAAGDSNNLVTTKWAGDADSIEPRFPIPSSSIYQDISMTCKRSMQTVPSVCQATEDVHQSPLSEWSRTATSSVSTSELNARAESLCSSTLSEFESQPKQTQNYQTEPQERLSPDSPSPARGTEARIRVLQVYAPYVGNSRVFECAGASPRFFQAWQAHLGSPPVGGQIHARSSAVEKNIYGSNSPASLIDMGSGLQHTFLSRAILESRVPKPPSKWDDAEKWIASPGHHELPAQSQQRSVHIRPPAGRRHSIGSQAQLYTYGVGSPEYSNQKGYLSPPFEHTIVSADGVRIKRRSASQKKRSKTLSFGNLSRKFELSRSPGSPLAPSDASGLLLGEGLDEHGKGRVMSSTTYSADRTNYASSRDEGRTELNEGPESPSFLGYESPNMEGISNSPILDKSVLVHIEKRVRSAVLMKDSSTSPRQPPVPAGFRSPSMDMDTDVSLTESQKNSTSTTPAFITSPTRHNTPAVRSGRGTAVIGPMPWFGVLELKTHHLAKLQEHRELEGYGHPTFTRNTAWSSREEEDLESSARLRPCDQDIDLEDDARVARAALWEEVEQTKYAARFHKEAAKIAAWEGLQKAKAETKLQITEEKLENRRREAYEKMMRKKAAATRKAEEMRAAAQATRNDQAGKTALRAEQIRMGGNQYSRVMKCCLVPCR